MPSRNVTTGRGARRRAGGLTSGTLIALAALAPAAGTAAQAPARSYESPAFGRAVADSGDLDALVARALAASPRISAAAARVEAARQRVAPAGALPDPMLMAGVQNLPVSEPGFADFMTMKMVGIGQAIPYPGKRSLRARATEHELEAARAALDEARLETTEAVKRAYYDLAHLDRALEIVERNQGLLVDFLKVSESRYGVGTGSQGDVIRLGLEIARIGEEAVVLVEQRRAALAQLNAALDRPSDTPVRGPAVPRRIVDAAVADSAAAVRFTSDALGARAADSPLPPLDVLQATALRRSPVLRAHASMVAAQAARAELARREHLPDFDVTVAYGQRDGYSDMITATVSVPIALQRGRRQDRLAAEARSELAALEAEHHDRANALRADVARLHAAAERDRAQLALYVKAILPQGRAALASATAGYRAGRADFLSLLDAQATLFTYETTYFRVLSDFARTLAELERVVGEEIVR